MLPMLDALVAVFSLFSAYAIRLGSDAFQGPLEGQTLRVAAIFVIVSLFSSYLMEVYSLEGKASKRELLVTCLQAGGAGFFFLSVVYYLDPDVMLGRGVLFLSIGFFVLLQFVCHALTGRVGYEDPFVQRVLVLGTGELARGIGELVGTRAMSFALAGFLPCAENEGSIPPAVSPVVQMEGDLLATMHKHRARILVVALSERRGALPLQGMMQCKLNGIEVLDAPAFYELAQGKLMLEQITPSWIIFSHGFRRTALVNAYKRCIDIALSLTGLLLTAPLLPLIALVIKLDTPGPVLFRQVRVGAGEKPFTLYKFRTMGTDAEKNGAVWASKNDTRVTKVGRFLRNSRIDEIPQLFNVLKGEMSFIGPRPERPEFVETLKKDIYYYSKRHTIKPGLTGWAQVRYPYGATTEDAVEKLRYDLYYIKNLSLFLDGLIIFETVKVVLFGRGGR
ncbi:TIGR03013 family XrtA/PEP-CTERM system glycosyltransferase [Geomonas sp. Red32]|uniref:TIGR03013 family XrtA/PEP-CTERM system glycosyltransferase n=1 Tax=Geomonas sp. Red32 TaxID=2912856 RepID=UPI00202CB360|nr:TIGR03013 family XrtA/PEP-CTERM system glycosyltransferase [Geomonas sp. Red32]